MATMVSRVVKFIRKGDKGDDAVIYYLIPSVTSVTLSNVRNGSGTPTPSSVSVRLVKKVGGDTPTTIANPSSVGMAISYQYIRKDGKAEDNWNGSTASISGSTVYSQVVFYLKQGSEIIDTKTIAIIPDGEQGNPGNDGVSYSVIVTPKSISVDADGNTSLANVETDAIMATAIKNVGGVDYEAKDGTMYLVYVNKDTGEQSSVATNGIATYKKDIYSSITFEYRVGGKVVASSALNIDRTGATGEAGEDGISIDVLPRNLLLKPDSGILIVKVYVDLYEGGKRVPYQENGFVCSTLTDTEVLKWGFDVDAENRFCYRFIYLNKTCDAYEIPFTVTYKGKQYPQTLYVTTVADGEKGDPGEKGDRGPSLRGPQAWSDCAVGYKFQAGGDGEDYKDVVMYGNNYYSCVKSHTKTASNYPGSTADTNNKYWQLGDKVELIATKILLATYALVKNLGVETIDMKDSSGNVLFQAKDGNVTCKTGTFENIKVSGDITAEYLNLKVSTKTHGSTPELADGAICLNADGITLPELPKGTARSMRVLNPLQTRTAPNTMVLKPASSNVKISKNLSYLEAVSSNVSLAECGFNAGKYFELIGVHAATDTITYWLLSEMNSGYKTT